MYTSFPEKFNNIFSIMNIPDHLQVKEWYDEPVSNPIGPLNAGQSRPAPRNYKNEYINLLKDPDFSIVLPYIWNDTLSKKSFKSFPADHIDKEVSTEIATSYFNLLSKAQLAIDYDNMFKAHWVISKRLSRWNREKLIDELIAGHEKIITFINLDNRTRRAVANESDDSVMDKIAKDRAEKRKNKNKNANNNSKEKSKNSKDNSDTSSDDDLPTKPSNPIKLTGIKRNYSTLEESAIVIDKLKDELKYHRHMSKRRKKIFQRKSLLQEVK